MGGSASANPQPGLVGSHPAARWCAGRTSGLWDPGKTPLEKKENHISEGTQVRHLTAPHVPPPTEDTARGHREWILRGGPPR